MGFVNCRQQFSSDVRRRRDERDVGTDARRLCHGWRRGSGPERASRPSPDILGTTLQVGHLSCCRECAHSPCVWWGWKDAVLPLLVVCRALRHSSTGHPPPETAARHQLIHQIPQFRARVQTPWMFWRAPISGASARYVMSLIYVTQRRANCAHARAVHVHTVPAGRNLNSIIFYSRFHGSRSSTQFSNPPTPQTPADRETQGADGHKPPFINAGCGWPWRQALLPC